MKYRKPSRRFKATTRLFRILNDWEFSFPRRPNSHGSVLVNSKHKFAILHHWKPGENEPDDFMLHESLHCALSAFSSMDKRKPKELFHAEEKLVQDICKLVFPNVKSTQQGK